MSEKHEQNRQAWNEAAVDYHRKLQKDIEFLKSGGINLEPVELELLSPLRDNIDRCIHLQCAGGTDTLSFINFGAKEVIGVDISDEMINVAKLKTDELKMNARWIRADVLNIPSELSGTADLVYTGRGALIWMMDLQAWAKIIALLLKPGGTFYVFDGHPFTYFFDITASELKIDANYKGYFYKGNYESTSWPETYVGKVKEDESKQSKKYERVWTVSEVINALIGAGLVIDRFEEHPEKYWDEFPHIPESQRTRFPNTFSILARKTL